MGKKISKQIDKNGQENVVKSAQCGEKLTIVEKKGIKLAKITKNWKKSNKCRKFGKT